MPPPRRAYSFDATALQVTQITTEYVLWKNGSMICDEPLTNRVGDPVLDSKLMGE
jgi:hypothetical protein